MRTGTTRPCSPEAVTLPRRLCAAPSLRARSAATSRRGRTSSASRFRPGSRERSVAPRRRPSPSTRRAWRFSTPGSPPGPSSFSSVALALSPTRARGWQRSSQSSPHRLFRARHGRALPQRSPRSDSSRGGHQAQPLSGYGPSGGRHHQARGWPRCARHGAGDGLVRACRRDRASRLALWPSWRRGSGGVSRRAGEVPARARSREGRRTGPRRAPWPGGRGPLLGVGRTPLGGPHGVREGTRREHIVKDRYARPRGVLTTAGQTRNVHRRVNPGQRCCSALEYGLQQAQR